MRGGYGEYLEERFCIRNMDVFDGFPMFIKVLPLVTIICFWWRCSKKKLGALSFHPCLVGNSVLLISHSQNKLHGVMERT